MPTDIVTLAQAHRRRLIARDDAELRRVTAAYGRIYRQMAAEAELLGVDIADMGTVTAAQIRKLERYQALLAQMQAELDKFASWLGYELPETARGMVDLARADTIGMLRGYGVRGTFNNLPTEAIQALLGFLDPEGALYDRLSRLGEYTARRVGDMLLEGLTKGLNPRTVARQLVREGLGLGLTDALRMTRTVNLYSYREASRANYQANSDVVEGWIWWCELDDLACPACLSEHGSFHTLDETLNGHYNCRCTPLPKLIGMDGPVTSSEDWFNQQSEAAQKKIMGKGMLAAYREGKITWGQLIGHHNDDVYGDMVTVPPLKDLVTDVLTE